MDTQNGYPTIKKEINTEQNVQYLKIKNKKFNIEGKVECSVLKKDTNNKINMSNDGKMMNMIVHN